MLRADVDEGLDAVIRKALALDPNERYLKADELTRGLAERLLRNESITGAEEIGDFVRQLCPEAYAEQRKLISKVTTLRPKTPAPGQVGSGGMSAHRSGAASATSSPSSFMAGLDATTVRSPNADGARPNTLLRLRRRLLRHRHLRGELERPSF